VLSPGAIGQTFAALESFDSLEDVTSLVKLIAR
jgi:hypothetical protein